MSILMDAFVRLFRGSDDSTTVDTLVKIFGCGKVTKKDGRHKKDGQHALVPQRRGILSVERAQ